MLTILITAIIVAIIGIVLWQTKGFKSLREKNRAAEEIEEGYLGLGLAAKEAGVTFDKLHDLIQEAKTTTEDAKEEDLTKLNYHAVVDPVWKAQVNADNFAAYPDESIKQTTEHPPKVRVEIAKCFDYIRENIEFFAVDFWNAGFQIFPKTDDSPVKSIVVNDGRIDIDELQTNFALFPSESALFSNLAKQEFERRAVESSVITHEKLKKFAERLPKGEKKVGIAAKTRTKVSTKKVSKGKK